MQFDYVIVGGGASGCVLANRLSAAKDRSVLLLEAGGSDAHPLVHMPLGFAFMLGKERFDWRYAYEPEPQLNNRILYCPRGKMLGGSGSLNAMVYVRGHAHDYEAWRAMGNVGWGWDDVLPYFKRAENCAVGDAAEHGHRGPMTIVSSPAWHPLDELVLRAAEQAGIPRIADHNTAHPNGLAPVSVNVRNGFRCSAAKAYLKPARSRANLRVETQARVERVLFEGKRAVGVQYRRGGELHTVRANAEVILSAGAVDSPKLLELSGVGAGQRLRALGIDVVHDLPSVGENMQDHFLLFVRARLKDMSSVNEELRGSRMLRNVLQYLLTRRGLLSGPHTHIIGYTQVRPEAPSADIQFMIAPVTFAPVATKGSNETKVVLDSEPGVSIGFCQCRPQSRGYVHIRSKDVATPPSIHANFLASELDRDIVIRGLRTARQITQEPALAQYLKEEFSPGPQARSDEDLLAYARANGDSAYHIAGTCRMGTDAQAVVDPQLRVHGMERLRIVDASIMPQIVSANTHAASIMIGERASDLILNSH
ncbi:MAG: GMC family oxidoreductase N-terminal domain-containing protein [Steroidobacteraceae bacterium]